MMDTVKIVLEKIRNTKRPVVLYCGGPYGEKAYDYILGHGIKPVCMCDNAVEKNGKLFFDLPIFNYQQCRTKYPDCIYIITSDGVFNGRLIGRELEADGFIREKDFFVFYDYMENIPENYLGNIIPLKPMVLTGNAFLCKCLSHVLKSSVKAENSKIIYCNEFDSPGIGSNSDKMECLSLEQCKESYPDAMYFTVYKTLDDERKSKTICSALENNNIKSISSYFADAPFLLDYLDLVPVEEKTEQTTGMVKRNSNKIRIEDINDVLYLFNSSFSGTAFFDSIIDSHPNILSLGYSQLQTNLWKYIEELKDAVTLEEFPFKLLEFFEKSLYDLYGNSHIFMEEAFPDVERFTLEFKQAVSGRTVLNAKELFIAVFIAYHYMIHQKETRPKESKIVLYLEPHNGGRLLETHAKWLCNNFERITFLKLIRNTISKAGSSFRYRIGTGGGLDLPSVRWLSGFGMETKPLKKYDDCVLALKFEDIKLHPHKTLGYLCKKLQIPWSDTLLETTINGSSWVYDAGKSYSTTGYDLRAVYNTYDEYFSSFDRFRLDLLVREKQKAYGYPYLDYDRYNFSMKQLEEFFRFPYKFSKYIKFSNEKQEGRFWDEFFETNLDTLKKMEHIDRYKEQYDFYDYYQCDLEQ